MNKFFHCPVMVDEVVSILQPGKINFYVDGTLGAAGHAHAILEKAGLQAKFLGLDRDEQALNLAEKNLSHFKINKHFALANFSEMRLALDQLNWGLPDAVLLDLGVSSMQLDQEARGFSFMKNGPLDMNMGLASDNARDLVNQVDEQGLAKIIYDYGQESFAWPLAKAIVKQREVEPINTTGQLAAIADAIIPLKVKKKRNKHAATLLFQAIRIAVNDELGSLERFLKSAPDIVDKQGRLAVLSYHSLEDRMVKTFFKKYANPCTCPVNLPKCVCGQTPVFKLLRASAVKPTEKEVGQNSRARSARLRVVERL